MDRDDLRWWIAFVAFVISSSAAVIALALIAASMFPIKALAHTAPSGWVYPPGCCRDHMDCQMIPSQYVHVEGDRLRIEIPPGVHRHAPQGILHRMDMTSPSLKLSGDGDVHACIGLTDYRKPPGLDNKPIFRCLYWYGGV